MGVNRGLPHFALICLISRAYTVPTQTKNGLQPKL